MYNLARKYRPHLLSDLVGQEVVVKTLTNAIEKNRLHQAYLMTGQFGSGKTTAGRILAAMENCLVSPGLNPCGKCDLCVAVYEGKHNDIQEMDAAGEAAKVEQMRKLKESAFYNPVSGAKTKYYILDEAQRLSEASNDALLKLLEEPPPNVRFVLTTTDPQKLRPAIVSRCQRHDFKKIYWAQISEQLQKIAKLEKIDCEVQALNLCARLANGSMRSAIQNLEKLIAFAGNNSITGEDAQKMFGTPGETMYYDLLDQAIGIADGRPDATAGFRIINKMLSGGSDFAVIYEGIVEHLRGLMVGCTSSKATEFMVLSEEGKNRLAPQLKKIQQRDKLNGVLESIKKIHEARTSVDFNIPPETALQQWFVESIFAFR